MGEVGYGGGRTPVGPGKEAGTTGGYRREEADLPALSVRYYLNDVRAGSRWRRMNSWKWTMPSSIGD